MLLKSLFIASLSLTSCCLAVRAEEPPTVMTTRGALLLSEDFAHPIAPFEGKTKGFASGFTGWCYRPGADQHNIWKVDNGILTGIESAAAHHPATLSYGLDCQDAVIQCEVRLNDVPAEGRLYRSLFIKATDEKDYVGGLFLGPGGITLIPYSATRIDPKTRQRDKDPAARASVPVKLNEWHTVLFEIKGDEMTGTLDGKSATCQNPLLASKKCSIMLGVGTEASFRHLRVWQALDNPGWAAKKAAVPAPPKQGAQK